MTNKNRNYGSNSCTIFKPGAPGHSFSSDIYSFTRQESVDIHVNKNLINAEDRVLIVDDFLAHGKVLRGMVEIIEQTGATLVGIGIIIEKKFQGGGEALRKKGIRVESLATIIS